MIINEILAYAQSHIQTLTGLTAAQVHLVDPVATDPSLLPDVELCRLPDEGLDEVTDSAGGQLRSVSFGVSIAIESRDQSDTDALAEQVIQAILQDYTLGGLVQDTRWEKQEWGTGQQSAGIAMTSLTFKAIYPWYRPSNW